MTSHFKQLTLALLCLTVAGAVLAAQPGTKLPATTTSPIGTIGAVQMAAPGVLTGLDTINPAHEDNLYAGTILAGSEMYFELKGTGSCKGELKPGDDSPVLKFDGKLPLKVKHTYSEGSLLQSEAKSFPITITTFDKCTNSMVGPRIAIVQKPPPPRVHSFEQILQYPIAGTPTKLTLVVTGKCKFHVSYVNLDAQGNVIMKQYPMMPMYAPDVGVYYMPVKMLDATPAGTYKWTATGVEGCTGNVNTTFTVQ